MKHIIRAIIFMIILFFVAEHYQYAPNMMGIISVLFIIAFIYFIAGIIGAIRRRIVNRKQPVNVAANTSKNNSGCASLLLILLLLAIIYVFKAQLGMYSTKVFHFSDALLQLSSGITPIIGWSLLGLLIGSIYGSFVAWKKYKLNAGVNLIPIGVLVLLLTILYLSNKPMNAWAVETAGNTQTMYAYNLVTVEVYNTSTDDNKVLYKPVFLIDSSDKTAWIANISYSSPEVRFSFKGLQSYADKEVQCTGFMIKNGYRKSPELWENFARAKRLSINHNGSLIAAAIVNDKNSDSEEVKIAPVIINSFDNISITFNSVYAGEKYPDRLAITELVPIIQFKNE